MGVGVSISVSVGLAVAVGVDSLSVDDEQPATMEELAKASEHKYRLLFTK